MSKKVISNIEGFKGLVVFRQPLNLEQVFAIEDAQDSAVDLEPSSFLMKVNEADGKKDADGNAIKVSWSSRADKFLIPALLLCIEKFEIEGFPENITFETFPLTPRSESQQFIDFLWSELVKVYQGEKEIPNAS